MHPAQFESIFQAHWFNWSLCVDHRWKSITLYCSLEQLTLLDLGGRMRNRNMGCIIYTL